MRRNLTTLPFDYVARQKIGGTSLTYFYLKQFPVLPPSAFSPRDLDFVHSRVLELTYTSHAMKLWAEDLGYSGQPFVWDDGRRAQLRAELDVFFARKYGLTDQELRYLLDPAKVKGADYPSETFRVLKEKETRLYGEYRTERLVLDAWKRTEAGAAPSIVPSLEELLAHIDDRPENDWAWSSSTQPRDRLRYSAQYALWLMDSTIDGSHIRFVIACLAEPALLTPLLTADNRKRWIRLVGSDAQPPQGAVRLRPDLNAAWRSMFEALITSGQLAESADGAWTQGQHFNTAGLEANSIHAQRAAFAMRAVRGMAIGKLNAAVAQEDNVVWVRFGNG